MQRDTPVTITIRAGLIAGREGAVFVGTAHPGAGGTYAGEHPTLDEWHLIAVDVGADLIEVDEGASELVAERGLELYAPLHESQFEAGEVAV